jgi:TPP-dependent pyruvate/acetoin dehydrogenase alpha subunit
MKDVKIPKKKLAEMYKKMLHVRYFEDKVAYFFSLGMVHGTAHLYVGEEATGVGACAALSEEDLITSTHRGHGHCIGKGIDLNMMMAEFLGKETGYCKGRGGSMHIADLSRGNLGANGVVGGGMPIAVGAGLTTKMKNLDRIVLCFFGDGATNQGIFHESLNLASIWKLPILFLCENNQYGMSMNWRKSMSVDDIAVRATSYGMKSKTVDGNDIFVVYDAVRKAKEMVKENGPFLLVCNTYRILGHSKSDANLYRTKEEVRQWQEKCPINHMRKILEENALFTSDQLEEIERDAKEDIEAAVRYAEESPFPSIDTILDDVYA